MTGVSYMIPFVVAGGILLALSVMLYGKGAVPEVASDPNLKKLFDIGVVGLTLMVPFLAAYIGYAIADRAALAPAAIGAWVGASFGAGFWCHYRGLAGRYYRFLSEEDLRAKDAAFGDADLRDPDRRYPSHRWDHDVGLG